MEAFVKVSLVRTVFENALAARLVDNAQRTHRLLRNIVQLRVGRLRNVQVARAPKRNLREHRASVSIAELAIRLLVVCDEENL